MAVVQGFEYDIFISYAHKDNQPPHRWVEQFHDDLENWLKHRRGFSDLKLWRDPALDGATDFNLSIRNKIESSALFLALNSRNFRESEYCKKELDWFYNHNHVRHGGLLVGDRRRIFNVLLNNIPYPLWPDALSQTSGFHMHDANPVDDDLGEFISHNDALYEKRLRLIVDAVENILNEFSKTLELKVKDAEETGGSFILEGINNKITIYPSQQEKRLEAPKSDGGPDIGPNPYLGLGAFQERDAGRFYGREALTEKLWHKFRDLNDPSMNKDNIRLLPILGPSGSGKSSLARAGLIPALARTPIPSGVGARVAVLTPGNEPCQALAGILARIATGDTAPVQKTREFADEFKISNDNGEFDGLNRSIKLIPDIDTSPLIILVDQFEEIYSLCGDEAERSLFIDNLIYASSDQSGRLSVILTLRSDFLGETQAHQALNTAIAQFGEIIPAMKDDELRVAITEPSRNAGQPLRDSVVDMLIEQTRGREGALPLLQFTLTRIWENLSRGMAPGDTLIRIGGVGGSLAREAQRLYENLEDDEKPIARRAFLAMVSLGEGAKDTRRRVALSHIVTVDDDPSRVKQVLEKFSHQDARLITLSGESPENVAQTVEITHEALLDHWELLKVWLDESRDDLRLNRRLESAANRWEKHAHPGGLLWRRPDFDLLRAYYNRQKSDLSKNQIAFYQASEHALKIKRITTALTIAFFMLIIGVSFYVSNQQRIAAVSNEKKALEQKKNVENKRLEANYNLAKAFEEKALRALKDAQDQNKNRVDSFKKAQLYISAALEQEISPEKKALEYESIGKLLNPEIVRSAFAEKWFSPNPNFHSGPINTIAFSPDGKTIASGAGSDYKNEENTIRLWNEHTGELICELKGHLDPINSIAFSPDGKTIASGSMDRTISLWNVNTGEQKLKITGHTDSIYSVAFSPDGKTIASGAGDETIRLWSVQSGKQIFELKGHTYNINSVAFSPDGKTIASGSWDKTIRLWSVQSGKQIFELKGHDESINSVAFSPDGKTIATGSEDATIRLWNVLAGERVCELKGHMGPINSIAYSPDGKTIASGSWDKTIRLWNPKFGGQIHVFEGPSDYIQSVAFSPDGNTIASGSRDKIIRLWNVRTGKQFCELKGHTSHILCTAFSPDGNTIASGSLDKIIRLWNVRTGKQFCELKGHISIVSSIAFSPNGKIIASGSGDHTIRLWNAETGAQIRELKGHKEVVRSLAFSPNGNIIVSASGGGFRSDNNTIRMWNVQTGDQIGKLSGHRNSINSVAINPAGTIIASGSGSIGVRSPDNTIRLWNIQAGKQIREISGHTSSVESVAFSPDGNTIASGSWDKSIRLWNVQTGQQIKEFKGHNSYVNSVVFSPDGNIIASGSDDAIIRLWNAQTGLQVRELKGQETIRSVAFSPDGNTIASVSDDKTIRLWDVQVSKQVLEHKVGINRENLVTFSPHAKTIASGLYDGSIHLINVQTGKQVRELNEERLSVQSIIFSPDGRNIASGTYDDVIYIWDVQSGVTIRELKVHKLNYDNIIFSPDGHTIASGSNDGIIRLWNIQSGEQLCELKGHEESISSVAFSTDGNTIASGSHDKTIRLWNVKTGRQILVFRGHSDYVHNVAFSPDGITIASASGDESIRLWSRQTGEQIHKLKAGWSSTNCLVFSPDGETIASGFGSLSSDANNSIRLWNVQSGRQIRELKGQALSIINMVFKPDGNAIISVSGDGTIHSWDISTYTLFIRNGKPTELYKKFSEGMRFFWQVELDGLVFKRKYTPVLYAQDGYHFKYDKKFRPLLDPPAPGQSKYDQILEWAQKQVEK